MLFLIPHLFPPARLLETAAQDVSLPALQTLLVRGAPMRFPEEGMEAALCEALGITRQQDWPVAPMTLTADGGTGDGYWLRADPVHLRVMRDRIVLADSSVFELSQHEADALSATIGQHFGDALNPLPLHPTRWYLHQPHVPQLRTTPLSVAIGRDIHPLLPQGEAAGPLHALMNELQMLLFEHPVNLAREARGELPVNSLWVWGGGSTPAVPGARRVLYARDESARALGRFCGAQLVPLPEKGDASILKTEAIVLLDDLTPAGQCGDAYGWREAIREMEKNWFVPLLEALRTLDSSGLRVLDPVSGRGVTLHRMDAWKVWRRPRSLVLALA